MENLTLPSAENYFLAQHAALIADSYQKLLGYSLLVDDIENIPLAERLFNAPFALLSHNNEADPLFNYANAQALRLFEFDWQELIMLPSRLSAEPINQSARAELLAQVNTQGFIKNYQGIRISKTGKRFKISEAVVWNLVDEKGTYHGQAACFSNWTFL
ncbi:MAG: MEKHLA domain-containing protein [Methylococcales bacterium]|nr:MEKHLA domain-containing protein [Methylococcales bacterium]MDD5753675.1 MEKHLA domain-containing protein [Methylococcales bacterium]